MTTHTQGATTGLSTPVTPGEIPQTDCCVESMVTPGARSTDAAKHEQRMSGLRRANEVRSWRAFIRREMKKQGKALVIDVVLSPLPKELNWRVEAFLSHIPKVGKVTVRRIMLRVGISDATTLGSLTDRQRDALMAELRRTS